MVDRLQLMIYFLKILVMRQLDSVDDSDGFLPLVINTWNFQIAAQTAKEVLEKGGSCLDAVEEGCAACERSGTDGTVGPGGSPDENGESTLDALIMDGETHDVGAVGGLRRISTGIRVARKVLENTKHTLLVGSLASEFAIKMGFEERNISSEKSLEMWAKWRENNCQPNFWKNVDPDPNSKCGPYTPVNLNSNLIQVGKAQDTVGLIVVDVNGRMAAGTSSNGAKFKIPGRVGDSPIPGSGAYVDREIGAAVATGDGDVLMRFVPSAVEAMGRGQTPTEAAEYALAKINRYHPDYEGALLAVTKLGQFGAACHGFADFQFCVWNPTLKDVKIIKVNCSH